eukprot:COSAG01_NODE_14923_length_1395_cov_1.472222_2_plen_190_part_00
MLCGGVACFLDPRVLQDNSETQAQLAQMFIRQQMPQLSFPSRIEHCDDHCETQYSRKFGKPKIVTLPKIGISANGHRRMQEVPPNTVAVRLHIELSSVSEQEVSALERTLTQGIERGNGRRQLMDVGLASNTESGAGTARRKDELDDVLCGEAEHRAAVAEARSERYRQEVELLRAELAAFTKTRTPPL